jgi:ABC-type Fe3+-siderophore transport system permease subunit
MKIPAYAQGLFVIAAAGLLILLIAVVNLNSGKMNLSPAEVLNVLLGKGNARQNLIVFEFRLPRIILSLLVGIGMGALGCIMQSLLRNDMASHGTLGISSGSRLFVLLYIVAFPGRGALPVLAMPVLSFAGGISAAALIFLFSFRRGRDISPTGLILTGVALGSGYGAATTLLILKLDERQMDFVQR